MLNFEQKVLKVVDAIANGGYFFNGTLCVPSITEDTAKCVLSDLQYMFDCKVLMSSIPDEYLFDFV